MEAKQETLRSGSASPSLCLSFCLSEMLGMVWREEKGITPSLTILARRNEGGVSRGLVSTLLLLRGGAQKADLAKPRAHSQE